MKTKIALALLLLSLPIAASAATVKNGAPGCMTADLLDLLLSAIIKDDQATGESLLHNGCVIVNRDMDAEILQVTTDKLEIKVSNGETSLVMWVPIKYVEN